MNRITVARLTDTEVLALRARKLAGEPINIKAEADRFACGVETIRKILRGDTFRHLLRGEAPRKAPPLSVEPSEAEMAASLAAFLGQVKIEETAADIEELLSFPPRNTPA